MEGISDGCCIIGSRGIGCGFCVFINLKGDVLDSFGRKYFVRCWGYVFFVERFDEYFVDFVGFVVVGNDILVYDFFVSGKIVVFFFVNIVVIVVLCVVWNKNGKNILFKINIGIGFNVFLGIGVF